MSDENSSQITPYDTGIQYIPKDNENGIYPVEYYIVTQVDVNSVDESIDHIAPISAESIALHASGGIGISAGGGGISPSIDDLLPKIIIESLQPLTRNVNEGSTITFTITASVKNSVNSPLTYQWQKSDSGSEVWTNISNATQSSYTTGTIVFANDHLDRYRCIVSAPIAVNSPFASSALTLNVQRVITITSQPVADSTYFTGQTATLNVGANISSGVISYQWQKKDFGSLTFVSINGATNSSYTTPILTISEDFNDTYRCILSNPNSDTKITNEIIIIISGADLKLTPSVDGKIFWSFSQHGPLVLNPSNSNSYTVECLLSNKNIRADMWGQGSCNSRGGYSGGIVPFVSGSGYTVKLNAGGGTGGNAGGGYAGIFKTDNIIQTNALLIAGGAGGGGASISQSCVYSGGAGGGLTGENAYTIPGGYSGGNGGTQTTAGAGGFALQGGNASGISINSSMQSEYTTPGTYSWTAPEGVTSVSVVCVGAGGNGGGGGGGGGGLGWKNNISVTPGQTYTVVVGSGGTNTTNGTDSYFINSSTVRGGGGKSATTAFGLTNTAGGSYTGDGGGNGGSGSVQTQWGGGGGGAGGYTGNGGDGNILYGSAGSGGAGGGGSGHSSIDTNDTKRKGGGGGGVGIYGQGSSGAGAPSTSYGGDGGFGGSGGINGSQSSTHNGGPGGSFGGGSGGTNDPSGSYSGQPGGGAVRIIWGSGRQFPSTNTSNASSFAGGGGGGGYFGGGGGTGFADRSTGGGGGSGFVAATVSGTTSGFVSAVSGVTRGTAGDINGNSVVVINYSVISITTQPTLSEIYLLGQTATMSVVATITSGVISYQWQKKNIGGNWENISGATSSSYTTPAIVANDGYSRYRCILSNVIADTVYTNDVILFLSSADIEIVPAINGKSFWSFVNDGTLILDPSNVTTYTITVVSSNLQKITTKMWGQGTCNAQGGYSRGIIPTTKGTVYTIKLNAGGGSGGMSFGSTSSDPGGGYAGIFNGTNITQASALLIAGGAGGAGRNANSCERTGGNGGGSAGSAGQSSDNSEACAQGGSGGTQSNGGSAGNGCGYNDIWTSNNIGTGGSALQGGQGGLGDYNLPYTNAPGGGGGGGGYWGGGGGAGGNDYGNGSRSGGGGGGGSGFVASSVISGVTQQFSEDPNRGSAGSAGGNSRVVIDQFSEFYTDPAGRILILSATTNRDPRTLTKTKGMVLPGTNECIDDARWQSFLNLSSASSNYRLAVTLDQTPFAVLQATDYNIHKLKTANRLTLRTSLTDWQPFIYGYRLAWDENSGDEGVGSDYSGLFWSNETYYGWAYYAVSNNFPFFGSYQYAQPSANWWILPPGVPDFSTTDIPSTYSITSNNYSVNEGSVVTITVNTTYVGDNSTLYWESGSSTIGTASNITPYSGIVTIQNNTGSFTITAIADNLTESGTQTFYVNLYRAQNSNLLATSSIITINDTSQTPLSPSGSFTASPSSINTGGSATLSWNISNATSVNINQGIGFVSSSGSRTVSPTSTTTYTLTASGPGGSLTLQQTVNVVCAPVRYTTSYANFTYGRVKFFNNTQGSYQPFFNSSLATSYYVPLPNKPSYSYGTVQDYVASYYRNNIGRPVDFGAIDPNNPSWVYNFNNDPSITTLTQLGAQINYAYNLPGGEASITAANGGRLGTFDDCGILI